MIDNRNMILAVVLSIAILMGFEFFFSKPKPPQDQQQAQTETTGQVPAPVAGQASTPSAAPAAPAVANPPGAPAIPGGPSSAAQQAASRQAALKTSPRVQVKTPRMHGSISLRGARIDDLTFDDYREELDPDSPQIVLLSPKGSKDAYFAEYGWVGSGLKVPTADTLWTASSKTLTPDVPLKLTWDNGAGLRFIRTIAIDDNYMFTVTQKVENSGSAAVTLFPYGLVSRHNTPDVTGFYILHEGLLGVFDETLQEIDYDDLQEKGVIQQKSKGGWIGITDKYWLMALIPDQKTEAGSRFVHSREGALDRYQVDYIGGGVTVQPGGSMQSVSHLFAGAKEVKVLDKYEADFLIKRFDLAIDFGWFYFLTKPIFYTLIYLNDHLGNFGLAILLLTVLIKIIFFPLANKSYKAMSKMKKLQPEMVKLRDQFGEDKVRLNQEMMALYKKEKASPASGCLPMIIQIPVFFALYKVLFVTIEMRHAPFYGWINDLSAPDPTSLFNLFGLIPFTPPDFLMIGVWPLLMGITMFLQQKLNPQPPDPMQAKLFMFLPIMFTFLLARFPAGLVIYWAWNNLLSIIQQKIIMVKMGVK